MKDSKNLLIAALALLAATATGVAWQQYWKAQRLAAGSVTSDEGSDLLKRLAAAERRNQALTAELEARTATPEETAAAATANTGPRDFGRGGRGPGGRGGFDPMMDRPEMQQLRTLQQKAALDSRYATLFKALNLGADKVAKLKTLMAERESTMQDVMSAAREQGVDPRNNPQEFRKLVTAAQAEVDTQIKSLLGDEAYAQYQQYQQTLPQRNTVEQLRQSLSYTSEPLTDAQATQLVGILAANAPTPQDGGSAPMPPPDGGGGGRGPGGGFGGGPGGGGAPITAAAVAQAQTVLSSTQAQALQQMQTLQQAQQQAMQAMRAAENQAPRGTGSNQTPGSRSTGRG